MAEKKQTEKKQTEQQDLEKKLEKAKKELEELKEKVASSEPKPTTKEKPLVLTDKAKAMKKELDKQEKVEIFIPLENKEKEGVKTITLNGYPFHIKKGVRVKVPKQVAEVYYDSVASQAQAVADAQKKANNIEGK